MTTVDRNSPPPPENAAAPAVRLVSIDAYRGLVMLLMMGEVLKFAEVAAAKPNSPFWAFLAHHQTHAQWTGCSLHDLIQPSFSFLVGAALPFSIAARRGRGQSFLRMTLHAWWRALLLVALGIFLRSLAAAHIVFTFEDTLTQIGLGYGLLFFLGFRPVRDQWIALAAILVGYWAAFALYPVPENFNYGAVGVPLEWLARYGFSGFAAHWNKNSNLAWAFDRWFLNLFPPRGWFDFNRGGYATLSFIPTLGTMILGLLAGGVLCGPRGPWHKVLWLTVAGLLLLAAGWLLGWLGICPVVKRIWTPSWALFSGGWCCLFTAAFYALLDIAKWRTWAFPLVVIGMNSIAAYCMAHLFENFIPRALLRHLGQRPFLAFGTEYRPLVLGASVLLVYWLILWAMYRRRVFLRV